jgi:serine kinase of HPr protein (carbohydrate metabolism regulator)
MMMIHASCVAVDGAGILLRGPSGSGKSDLALRMIDEGARLVADDQVVIAQTDGRIVASAPDRLAGLIEVRGLGVIRIDPLAQAPLILVADLMATDAIERMPEPDSTQLLGIDLPLFRLDPFPASASAKLRLAARVAAGGILRGR